jgi:hypothetical protein
MKSEQEIRKLLSLPIKTIEQELGIKIRNGQTMEGIRKALAWVKTKNG